MAASPIVTRERKARRIVDLGECIPLEGRPGWYEVVDTVNGSGEFHIASIQTCDCPDHLFRGRVCKHIAAARLQAAELAAYADAWDAQAQPIPTLSPTCPHCGAELLMCDYWIGGRGVIFFNECSANKYHYSVEA